LVAVDGTQPLPFIPAFDRILVDAPCSGSGTLARNPEIRWRLSAEDLAQAHRQQVAMLRNAFAMLAPGGQLVYSTCSLEPEENEQVVADVLSEDANVRTMDGVTTLPQHLHPDAETDSLFDSRRYFRTFPPESETDGFFAAALQRRQAE
jgi:16S rRNA (cytosine967-C5)-methyltransferase